MLLIVGLPLGLGLGAITGALLGVGAALRNRPFGLLVGAIFGLACSGIVLSLLLPLFIPPRRDDFLHLVTNPYLSLGYGASLGIVASWLFRWMDS